MDGGGPQGHGSVEVTLPDGGVVRVRVAENPGGIGSVGLADRPRLSDALAQIGEVARLVRESLQPLRPSKATVEFGVSFSVQSGKLTALVFEGKGDASLTVTLEWEQRAEDAVSPPSGT